MLVERFRAHLLSERGLKPNVATFYVAAVRPFVDRVSPAIHREDVGPALVIDLEHVRKRLLVGLSVSVVRHHGEDEHGDHGVVRGGVLMLTATQRS